MFQEVEYHFRPIQNLVRFKEVAVATSEQQCNDLARVLVVEGFSIYAVAYAMQLCLFFTGPQRSGLGGSSTTVFVDANNPSSSCHIVDTFADYQFSFIKDNPKKQMVGEYGTPFNSVALPGEVITLVLFAQEIAEDELKSLTLLLEDYQYDTYAISHDLAECNRVESPRLVQYFLGVEMQFLGRNGAVWVNSVRAA
ncbi:hypothetical protein ANCDUO_16904 [Ancylostoma duodenale]|uniref:Uncharacterized protein n=1 Tax=Ancylostoma duodenale TaxID=51022 RepID=A0A0C2G259_9BILA|nr:hypothetical protein ANCDUO_16904 [Ancylostoma duodenale]